MLLMRVGTRSTPDGSAVRSPAADVDFLAVTKRYPGQDRPAVDRLTLHVPAGEICCLVGPSGGGKTTAMKLINRLIDPTDGDIRIGGRSVLSIPATTLRREIGYVFQQIGLLPHLTIAGNIALTPRLLDWPKQRILSRTEELMHLVGLDQSFLNRYPSQLSGGQQQRVGLARALAADPPLMLMDEPFGALDPITRTRLQDEFLRVHRDIGKTVVFVTHDIDEAAKMGDRIAVLREGGILAQYGTPDEVLGTPADDYVAAFVGADRGLRRLGLRQVSDLPLRRPDHTSAEAQWPSVAHDASLRDALAVMFGSNSQYLTVRRGPDVVGTVSLEQLHNAIADTAHPGSAS